MAGDRFRTGADWRSRQPCDGVHTSLLRPARGIPSSGHTSRIWSASASLSRCRFPSLPMVASRHLVPSADGMFLYCSLSRQRLLAQLPRHRLGRRSL